MADTSVLKYDISFGADECDSTGDKKHEIKSEQTLVEASAAGISEKVIELLSSGVLVDANEYNKFLFYGSKNYMTPLQLASANGHIECVQILIHNGANVNAKDRFDVSALHMAAEKGHYLCLKALLDAGADCYSPTKFSKSSYRAVPHPGGTTPLHLAAANNRVDCVKELIQCGADYNAINECGHTSLFIATKSGFRECVLAHLKNAIGRDILSLPDFVTGDTPLHLAVSHRMIDCVRELLYLGSDVNHVNMAGSSPIHLALHNAGGKANVMEILKLLVLEGYNTDINLPDAEGHTPLHYVCFNNQNQKWLRRPKMANFLIAHGADVSIKSLNGLSLLHCELRAERSYEILKFIVNSMLQLPPVTEVCQPSLRERQRQSYVAAAAANRDQNPNLEYNESLVNHRRRFLTPSNSDMHPSFNLYSADEEDMNFLLQFYAPYRDLPPERQQALVPYLDYMSNYENNRLIKEEVNPEKINWELSLEEKRLWYDQEATNPRTLQHCCRYIVRQTLGSQKLKDVRKLPIPAAIKSYVLLDCNE